MNTTRSLSFDDILLPPPLIDKLRNENWAPLTTPNSNYTPGAIISVTTDETRWWGNLEDCFPEGVLKKAYGSAPSVHLVSSREFTLEALLKIFGIGFTGSLKNVKKVVLDVTDYGTDSLNMIKLIAWDKANPNKINEGCVDILNKESIYIVQEAFIVKKATYSLPDEKGGTIKLDQTNIGDVTFGGGATVNATNDGKLEIDKPTVYAVKKVARVGYGMHVQWIPIKRLGTSEFETADKQIMKLFASGAPMKE